MATEFHVSVQGYEPVLAVLATLLGRMGDLTPAWQEVGDVLVNRALNRIDSTKADPAGRPWADWSPDYEEWRKRKTGAVGRENLLELTRMMRKSLSATASKDGLTLGLGRSYAPYHETGTRWMPRRGMLLANLSPAELGEQDRAAVLEILMDYLPGEANG